MVHDFEHAVQCLGPLLLFELRLLIRSFDELVDLIFLEVLHRSESRRRDTALIHSHVFELLDQFGELSVEVDDLLRLLLLFDRHVVWPLGLLRLID